MNANMGENLEIFKTTGIPYHFQSQSVLSLPRPNVTFFILTSTGLSLLQQREPTVPSSPVINHTQASSCLKEVLPSITVLFLFKHTSFLLLPPLLYTEPPRCLFLPELK